MEVGIMTAKVTQIMLYPPLNQQDRVIDGFFADLRAIRGSSPTSAVRGGHVQLFRQRPDIECALLALSEEDAIEEQRRLTHHR